MGVGGLVVASLLRTLGNSRRIKCKKPKKYAPSPNSALIVYLKITIALPLTSFPFHLTLVFLTSEGLRPSIS